MGWRRLAGALLGLGTIVSVPPADATERPVASLLDRVPLAFEANAGHLDPRVRFVVRGAGQTLFLIADEAVLALAAPGAPEAPTASRHRPLRHEAVEPPAVVRMRFAGSKAGAEVTGIDRLPGTLNVFRGADPARWRTAVPRYAAVRYRDVYPGIDVLYHGAERRLAYDLLVAPGADPSRIAMTFEGAEGLALDEAGNLLVLVAGRSVRHQAPFAYQEIDGRRHEVASRFVLAGDGRVAIAVGEHDRARPLVIDPTLTYATFVGGSGYDVASAVAVDATGAVYVAGATTSADFPGTGTRTTNDFFDFFVTKLNPQGTAFVYTTILGGDNNDQALGIAVDAAGNAYVVGDTASANFPTLNAFQPTFHGGDLSGIDAFVARLSPTGAPVFSTFLGGSGDDSAAAVAVAPTGPGGAIQAFVTGYTTSPDFPVLHALQPAFGGAGTGTILPGDAFVVKLNANGTRVYATYLGGSDDDAGTGIAVDGAGSVYVTGITASTNFPTRGPLQPARAGATANYDLFVAKLTAAGRALVYSTYLGGSANEQGGGVAVDPLGRALVTGSSNSVDFPTANAFQPASAGSLDVVVAMLAPNGASLVFSTYLGGEGIDFGLGVGFDSGGHIFVTGATTSTTFPLKLPLKATNNGNFDAFVTRLTPDGRSLVYSTYLGGDGADFSNAVAVAPSGVAYVVGATDGGGPPPLAQFPATTGAAQSTFGGPPFDAFVAAIDPNAPPVITNPGPQVNQEGDSVSLAISASDPDGDTLTFSATGLPDGLAINPTTGVIAGILSFASAGVHSVTVTVTDGHGGTASTTFTWVVLDVPVANRPPVCTGAAPSVATIWPPDHRQVTVAIQGVTDPDGDPVMITITRVLQDEPTNDKGDANTPVDGGGVGTATAWVRAERSAQGDGRIYEIRFTATDGKGGTCAGSVKVAVPHTQNKPAIDSGARYDSTI